MIHIKNWKGASIIKIALPSASQIKPNQAKTKSIFSGNKDLFTTKGKNQCS